MGGRSRDRAGGPKGVQIPPAPVPHTPSPLERSPGAVALRLPRQAGFEPALGAWLCLVSLGLWLLSVPGAQVLAGPGGGPRAGGEPASERQRPTPAQVKSALLYNLVKYIQWPESAFGGPKEAFRIVVIGGDPLGAALDTAFEKKELHGRGFQVERRTELPERLEGHLLFLHGLSDEQRLAAIAQSRQRPLLLVSESPRFAAEGGFVRLHEREGKPRIEVNIDRQEDTGLRLTAELLKLVDIYTERGRRGERPPGSAERSEGQGNR